MFNYKYYEESFKVSQYEVDTEKEDGKFCYREHVDAKYIMQDHNDYSGNLLIEALPPIKDRDTAFDFLSKFPQYSEEERFRSDEYRIHAIFRLLDYRLPIGSDLLTDEFLSIAIKRGYVHKKIGTPAYYDVLRKANRNLVYGEENNLELATKCSIQSNISNGFLIIGASGCGKTTGVNNSLSYYPQVIHHSLDFNGRRSTFTQVPWVRVDCSYDGKISGVCSYFFDELDKLLGTDYSKQYGAKGFNYDKLIASMSFLALKYAIGVLVVDEIQFIRHTNNGESLFNFFVTLTNTIKIPIVFMGTYNAINTILGEQYAKGRKAEGIGDVEYFRLEQNDKSEWNTFIELLWNYQWVKYKIPLTQEMKDLMYKRSFGIIDRLIKIFMSVQLEAIYSKEEKVTLELIEEVATNKFRLADKIIKAYESGSEEDIIKFGDIVSPKMEVEDFINRNKTIEKINEIYNSNKLKETLNKQQAVDKIVYTLNNIMDYKKEEIEKVAIKVVNQIGFNKETSILLREVSKELVKKEIDSENKIEGKGSNSAVKKGIKKQKKSIPENFAKDSIKDVLEGIS